MRIINVQSIIALAVFLTGISSTSIAQASEIEIVLYDQRSGFPKGNFCSGFLVEYRSRKFAVSNFHCLEQHSIECSSIAVTQGYTDDSLQLYVRSIDPTIDEFLLEFEILNILDKQKNIDEILKTNFVVTSKCQSMVVQNEKLDVVVFEIDPQTSAEMVALDLNQQAYDFTENNLHSLTVAGHPRGRPLKTEKCRGISLSDRKDKFFFGTNCTTEPGSSGSPIFDSTSGRVVGVNWGGRSGSPGLYELQMGEAGYRKRATYFPQFAQGLVDFLSGNLSSGLLSPDKSQWISINGEITFALKFDIEALSSSERQQFNKIVQEVLHSHKQLNLNYRNRLSSLPISFRIEAPLGRPPQFPQIYLTDTASDVRKKILDLAQMR